MQKPALKDYLIKVVHWLLPAGAHMTRLKAGGIAALSFVAILTFSFTQAGRYVVDRGEQFLQFHIRTWLGFDPHLDPRIKILAFDDKAVGALDAIDMDLKGWADLLTAIAKQKPRAILIDRYFGQPLGREYAESFVSRLKDINVPIITGSLRTSDKINQRAEISPDLAQHDLMRMNRDGTLDALNWLETDKSYLYGPHPSIAEAFSGVGHFRYFDADYGRVQPFLRMSRTRAVPHWSFYAAGGPSIREGQIQVNNHPVPLNDRGLVTANIARRSSYMESKGATSLRSVLARVKEGRSLAGAIDAGDVVLILFMYTGHTDWVETPLGNMEGGYLMASMVHSVMSGDWLVPLGHQGAFILIASLIGMVIGFRFELLRVALIALFGSVGYAGLSIAGFVQGGFLVPWLIPVAAFIVTSMAIVLERVRVGERQAEKIRGALSGFLSPERLEQIARLPSGLKTEACGRHITVMFVDIVGYSLTAERLEPKAAFAQLKVLISQITGTIHRYGGVVDRTLGDGLLCFFGYHYDGSQTIPDHATHAVDCAIDVQMAILQRNLKAHDDGQPIYPLRIGINSDYVYIGDLGDERRIDFTLIGDGVNFAQRLESAAEPYTIMTSASTHDSITKLMFEPAITRRSIKIKHHDDLIDAYEVNAFNKDPKVLDLAIGHYRDSVGLKRKDERWHIPEGSRVVVLSSYCNGRVHNFSAEGLAVVLPKYIGRGVQFNLSLGEEESEIRQELSEAGLNPLVVEVRWGRPFKGEFLHGLLVKNINASQRDKLLNTLRKVVQNETKRMANAAKVQSAA